MLRITFRQIEAFYWSATLGTVAAAAKHLFVSQPAVTARVKELEDLLGIALLSRSQQGVQLTPAGRQLLQQAHQMLELGTDFERGSRNEIPPLDGILRLGADETSATVGVAEMVRQLRMRYPTLRVELSIERSKVLHEKLNRREVDIALQTSPASRPHVFDKFLGRVQVSWVAGAGMELAHLPLSPADAAMVPVIVNPLPSILHHVARDWLGAAADSGQLNTCNSLGTIITILREGQAISPLPVPLVIEQLKIGTLKLVESDPPLPPIGYYVSFLTEKQSAGVDTIVNVAEAVLRDAQFFVA